MSYRNLLRWTVLTLGLLLGTFFGHRALFPPAQNTNPAGEIAVAHAAPTPKTKPIEQIRLGERTTGRNPLREEVDEGPEPDPKTWRQVNLTMLKPSGKELQIQLLRPLDWLNEIGAKPGSSIHLDLPEMGATGPAKIRSITPCPPIQPGPGNIVTGRFIHEPDGELVNVRVEGLNEPIGCTSEHRFWSEDRQEFIEAGNLQGGEKVRTREWLAAVNSVTPRQSERVYNLEVHGEHVYDVSEAGVLVHNMCNPATAPLQLQQRLARGGKFVNPGGEALQLGQRRVAVFDTVTRKIYYDVSSAGSHLGVLQRHGLPIASGRYAGGFLEATQSGRLLFNPTSGTFPHMAPGLPSNILDRIRGTGVSITGLL